MNSAAEIEKKAACASPATARASRVLPVPGGPVEQHAVRHAAAEPAVAVGVAQEVDDLREFGLRLVDPRHVVEGHTDRLRVDPFRARAPEVAERARRAASRRASGEQHEQSHDQQRRAEAEQQLDQEGLPRVGRLGVDLDALFLEQRRELAAVPEARHLRREQLRGRRLLVARRIAQLFLVGAFDRVAARGDRFDLLALTCSRKTGLNGTVTRRSPPCWNSSTEIQLSAISASTNHRNPGRRCGGRPGGCSGMPRPSGAGATCQPRLSRGIGGRPSLCFVSGAWGSSGTARNATPAAALTPPCAPWEDRGCERADEAARQGVREGAAAAADRAGLHAGVDRGQARAGSWSSSRAATRRARTASSSASPST